MGTIVPAPTSLSDDTIRWSFADLLPYESRMIKMELFVPNSVDSALLFSGYLDLIVNDTHQRVDSFTTAQIIRCSYDPNDKISRTINSFGQENSILDNPLLYTIRFQNTGNDTAYNITIRDTLDEDLDLNTLEILGASHPYEVLLKSDRTLEFKFANIQLPDSAANEMNSHGFVSYSIKPFPDLQLPAVIENTAFIYFDFNASIQTNTTMDAFEDMGTGVYSEQKLIDIITVHPNPTADEIYIKVINQEIGSLDFVIRSMNGQEIKSGKINSEGNTRISLKDLPSGIYLLNVFDQNTFQTKLIIKG